MPIVDSFWEVLYVVLLNRCREAPEAAGERGASRTTQFDYGVTAFLTACFVPRPTCLPA
jgi:hypothetical protein